MSIYPIGVEEVFLCVMIIVAVWAIQLATSKRRKP